MNKLVICAAVAALAIESASAAQWQLLSSNAGGKVFVDRESMVLDGTVARAWIKVTYSTKQTVPMEAWSPYQLYPDAQIYDHVLHLFYFDCPAHTSSYAKSDYFNASDQLVGRFALMFPGRSALEPAEPGTLDELLLFKLCRHS